MRLLRSIFKTIAFVGICLTVWIMVNISRLIVSEHPNSNLEHVPSNSTFAIRIDGRALAENTLFSIILESKDEDIIKLFEESIRKRTSGEKEFTNTGINYLSDVVVFTSHLDGQEVNGMLFNLLNSKTFLKNMPDLLQKKQVVAAKNNVGVVLSLTGTGSAKNLQNYADRIVQTQNKGLHKIFHAGSAPNRFSEIHFHTAYNDKSESEVNLIFEQNEQAFELKGSMTSEHKTETNQLSHELVPDGFHVTTRLFSKSLGDSLRSKLAFLSSEIPTISSFSLNYRGVNIINHSSGFLAIPDAEFVIHCEEEFNVSEFLHSPELTGTMDCELTNEYIRFDEETLYFKQLSPTSFYIGRNANPKIISGSEKNYLMIKGDLNPITNIKGGGMMTAFLEMVPIFKASKQLSKSSEKIDFSIVKTSDTKAKIQGQLLFKEGKYPLSEVMRFLLSGNIIK